MNCFGLSKRVNISIISHHIALGRRPKRIVACISCCVSAQRLFSLAVIIAGNRIIICALNRYSQCAGAADTTIGSHLIRKGISQGVAGRAQSLHRRTAVIDHIVVAAIGTDLERAVLTNYFSAIGRCSGCNNREVGSSSADLGHNFAATSSRIIGQHIA